MFEFNENGRRDGKFPLFGHFPGGVCGRAVRTAAILQQVGTTMRLPGSYGWNRSEISV
jgi:hypothetical protein